MTVRMETKPFRGLSADQQFVPSLCFEDGNMRVQDEGKWWIVASNGRTMTADPDAPDAE
jgi:hypothetical protein